MKVLILGYVWPEPNSSAAGSRIVELITAFTDAGWLVEFASAATPTEHQVDLTGLGVSTHSIELNASSFDEFVAGRAPDIVVFDRFVTEEQFGWRVATACPTALRVLDTEDLHSLRLTREQLHKQAMKRDRKTALPVSIEKQALYQAMLSEGTILREVAAILRSDISLMISDVEKMLLQSQFAVPDYLLHHLPFMLNVQNINPMPDFAARRGFVCMGNFRHAPNWDAVLWLKETVWPEIRARLPGATLSVCGAYPPPKATALHNKREGFCVTGWVDNAEQTIMQHRVLLAPLRFGAGIKGKLVDAMQTGTPSVTTSVGAEAMHGIHPWPGEITDDPAAIAEAAVALHENELLWQEASEKSAPLLQARYTAPVLGSELTGLLGDLKRDLSAHRERNFLGQMMNHHSMRSSEFMSRWIEVKSRKNLENL